MATQSEINDFVEQIMPYFDPTPVEDDAVRQSWPRLDRGLSDVQDMTRFQHLYGILDHGEFGYWLEPHETDSATNQANTLFLTSGRDGRPAESTLRGCFHRLRETVELEFPPVTTPTTQYAVIEYDPVRSEGGGDPLVEKVVTSLDRSQGKDYLVLWEVDRKPSQLLSDAPMRRVRPRAGGVVYVRQEADKPNPQHLLWGTLCVVGATASIYRMAAANEAGGDAGELAWIPVTDPGWETFGDTPTYRYPGHGYRAAIQRVGKKRFLRGRVERTSGASFSPNSGGYRVVAPLAEGDRPSREVRVVTAGSNLASPNIAVVNISASGEVRVHPVSSQAWASLDGIEWDVE